MSDWDRVEEVSAKIRGVTDHVHDLLNGPHGEIIGGDAKLETMRVVLDIPKAWIHFAAWLEHTNHMRRSGVFGVAGNGDSLTWEYRRRLARFWLARMIENGMHEELHELCVGCHPFRLPPKGGAPVEAEPEVLAQAQAIYNDLDSEYPKAAQRYNQAVWAGDAAGAEHWRHVFRTFRDLWSAAGRSLDYQDYCMLEDVARYIAGDADQSPEEREAELKWLEERSQLETDDAEPVVPGEDDHPF